jgi:general secretion pathway protein N
MMVATTLERWGCVILAAGAFCLSSAFGQGATSVSLGENGTGENRLDAEPSPVGTTQSRAQRPPPAGNPLWGVSIGKLTATRERPLFTVSRRPPAPPIAAEPPAEAPPPPPAEPEPPQFILVGTVTGEPQNVVVVQDQTTKSLVRLRVGEAVSGWFLRSIDARRVTVEKNSQTVTVALPARGSPLAGPPVISETLQVGQKS